MASGHVNRTNRPNTWLHRPACGREESPCQPGAVHTWHFSDLARCLLFVRFQERSGHGLMIAPRLLMTDFVAEVADGRCELRLGAELPLAPSNEATALTPQRQRDLALTPHLGRPTVVAGRRA